jgi:hypothetical protein
VHPLLLDAYRDGTVVDVPTDGGAESAALAFLGRRFARPAPAAAAASSWEAC